MSAQEVIEQIVALPLNEQAVVAEFVTKMQSHQKQTGEVRYLDPAEVKAAAERIFERYDDLFRKLAK